MIVGFAFRQLRRIARLVGGIGGRPPATPPRRRAPLRVPLRAAIVVASCLVAGRDGAAFDGAGPLPADDVCRPTTLSTVPLGGAPLLVRNIEGRLWVATQEGISIHDVSDPAHPELLGRITGVADLEGLAVDGGIAWLAESTGELVAVDVSNLAEPVERGRLTVGQKARDVVVAGQRAFVAVAGEGVVVVDIADPAAPRVVGSWRDSDLRNQAVRLALSGSTLFVADSWKGLVILDVADVSAPRLLSRWGGEVERVELLSDGEVLAAGWTGLYLVDVSNRSLPVAGARIRDLSVDGFALMEGALWLPSWWGWVSIGRLAADRSEFRWLRDIRTPQSTTGLVVFPNALAVVVAEPHGIVLLDRPGCAASSQLVAAIGRPDAIVAGVPVTFHDRSDGTVASRRWTINGYDLPGGVSGASDPVYRFPDSWFGWHQLRLDVRGPDGATSSALASLEILPAGSCAPKIRLRPPAIYGPMMELVEREADGALFGVVASESGRALEIWELTDPARPALRNRNHLEDSPTGLAVRGTTAAVAVGDRLVVFDLAEVEAPRRRGDVTVLGSYESDVALSDDGTTIFAASRWNGGLVVVDASDPEAPRVVGRDPVTGSAVELRVVGPRLYYAAGGELRAYDLSRPSSPVLLGSLKFPGAWDLSGFEVDGNLVHFPVGDGAVQVWDFTDPSAPVRLNETAGSPGGGSLAILGGRGVAASSGGGLSLFDLGIRSAPRKLGSYFYGSSFRRLSISSGRLVAADAWGGLSLVDLDDCRAVPVRPQGSFTWSPTVPLEGEPVTFRNVSSGFPESWSWNFGDGSGSSAYAPRHTFHPYGDTTVRLTVTNDAGTHTAVERIGIARPSRPPDAAFDFVPRWPNTGETVRFVDRSTGVPTGWRWAFDDHSTAANAEVSRSFDAPGVQRVSLTVRNRAGADAVARDLPIGSCRPTRAGVAGSRSGFRVALGRGFAWVMESWRTLRIYDVTPPSSPVRVGTWDFPDDSTSWAGDLALSGNFLYVAGLTHGVAVLDVANRAHVVELARVATGDRSLAVALAGSLLFVADGAAGLRIFNVAEPWNPTPVGHWKSRIEAVDVAVSGSLAFVVDSSDGIQVLDVSTPSVPRLLGSPPESYGLSGLALFAGDGLLVDVGPRGFALFDASEPGCPPEISRWPTVDRIVGAALDDGTLALVAEGGKLTLYDLSDPVAPREFARYDAGDDLSLLALDGPLAAIASRRGTVLVDLASCRASGE